MRKHCTPGALAARLRPEDRELALETEDGRRLARCLRCDVWVEGVPPAPGAEAYEVVPPLSQLKLPRRGKPLEEAILLRLIAVDRAVHAVVFGLLAIALVIIDTKLFDLQRWAQDLYDRVHGADVGPRASHDVLADQLRKLGNLDRHTITLLAVTATIYAAIEGTEAVGLWLERRWAEYLTAIATAGFLPFEIHELLDHVTALRVGALVVNVAILVYLVYAKHLFGVRGGPKALHEAIDWAEILAPPTPHREQTLST
jgi:uncharacterized membrane protein (DUF2068 family)